MNQAGRIVVWAGAASLMALALGCEALSEITDKLTGDNGQSGTGGRQTRVELDLGDPAAVATVGSGSCLSMPFPRSCFTEPHGGVSCSVGADGAKPSGTGMMIHANGCVGAVRVLEVGQVPDLGAGLAAWVAPNRVSGPGPCCAEASPANQVAHIGSFDPRSRALFVRTAEPVTGPTQVSFTSSGPQPNSGYVWRFYVGGEPPP